MIMVDLFQKLCCRFLFLLLLVQDVHCFSADQKTIILAVVGVVSFIITTLVVIMIICCLIDKNKMDKAFKKKRQNNATRVQNMGRSNNAVAPQVPSYYNSPGFYGGGMYGEQPPSYPGMGMGMAGDMTQGTVATGGTSSGATQGERRKKKKKKAAKKRDADDQDDDAGEATLEMSQGRGELRDEDDDEDVTEM